MEIVRHKYEYPVDVNADTAPARVVRMVGENKRVLEIGAGPGSITKLLQAIGNCRITALEIDSEAIKKLAVYCERIYQADLNDPTWPLILKDEAKFEVVVAADVLEHVYEPKAVLSAMKQFLNDTGCIVISLPHIGHSAVHACLTEENFEYRDWGLLDRTHIRFFGIKNMQKLFEDAGLKIAHAEFVVRKPEQTEFADIWSRTSSTLRSALAQNPFGLVYQVVVKAVPITAEARGISLMDLPVEAGKAACRGGLRAFVSPYVSPRVRIKLRSLAAKIGIKL